MKSITMFSTLLALGSFTAYSQEPAPANDSVSQFAAVTPGGAVQADTTRPPADFVPVDKAPVVVAKSEPAYPALAIKAGIEGIVWVKIWVDKTGKPRDVVILKSEQEILNKPALDAAWEFRFTPGYIKDKPVDVWVSVPFKFRLAEKREPNKTVTDTARPNFPEEVTQFVRNVLEGGSPDTGSVSRFVAGGAEAIAGGYLKPLVQALEEQRSGKQSIEQSRRLVVFCTGGMSDDGHSGFIVARTESRGKETRPHYHTIVIQQNAAGDWKIIHWHTWHSSR